jgi:mortality factor 4-like protein 1
LDLPASKSIRAITEDYKAWVKISNPFEISTQALMTDPEDSQTPFELHLQIVEEVCDGLLEYFNISIGALLLYSTERLQYKNILAEISSSKGSEAFQNGKGSEEEKEFVDVYGAHHLLRLFTKLPEMMSKLSMTTETIYLLRDHFNMLLNYLDTHSSTLFTASDYCNLSPDQLSQLNKSLH